MEENISKVIEKISSKKFYRGIIREINDLITTLNFVNEVRNEKIEMFHNIERIDNAAKKILDVLKVDIKEIDKNIELGHYTSLNTLKYLFNKSDNNKVNDNLGKLRLTNIKHMNDPLEGLSLYEYLGIVNIINERTKNKNDNISIHSHYSKMYVSSLTTEKDNLMMWKMYGDNGKGVFLNLDTSFLLKSKNKIELYKVCYISTVDKNENNSVLNSDFDEKQVEILNKGLKEIKVAVSDSIEQYGDSMINNVIEVLEKLSVVIKKSDYYFEKEYRLLYESESKDEIVECDTKYKYLPLLYYYHNEEVQYSSITLGPQIEDKELDYIIPYIIFKMDEDFKIIKSNISYRDI